MTREITTDPAAGEPIDGAASPAATSAPDVLVITDPRTGRPLGRYAVTDADAVTATVERARTAAAWWRAQGFDGRRVWLKRWKRAIASGADDLAEVIAAETGKPIDDALLEVMLAVEHLDWAGRNARRVLRRRSVSPGIVSANQAASVGYEPMGVVGVIGPWNYPAYTPMGSISYALAAGNAIVFKPSELTPGVGARLAAFWAELGAPEPVVQVIVGPGATGDALVRAGVDKVAFTGSAATARRVMATCAQSLTPLVVEGGGKDALIVAADADLPAAADFAVFGGLGNAGQTCAGVERVLVESPVYEQFLVEVRSRAEKLTITGPAPAYGPMTLPRKVDIVRDQVAEALAAGATAIVGGAEAFTGRRIAPIVLTDVPADSSAATEETFGPTLVIERVASLDEAVRRANATAYGLGASVFTADRETGTRIADELRCGMVSINSVLGFAGIGALPFGGVGDSGFGRIHGADGLREFSRPKAVTRQRFPAPLNLLTFDRKRRDMTISRWMLRMRHGR